MISFTKLRLSGFKSFVDATELLIEPGMTGVVGPNGCGKSNLIEALRWVMGETSARNMRGGEMDDVIFGGTQTRPKRDLCEVTVTLDNRDRTAPPHYDMDELEVTRRIERDRGSNYRVNGKDVRARDVQLLFADAATGARSSGLVSQGRVGALIAAKPSERRGLLEEAAGISGLHSRRHEAELRLKNTEANLARLDDVLVTLDDQLKSLQKQAKQAIRYRHLSEQIKTLEAQVLYLQWLAALAAMDQARADKIKADQRVEDLTGEVAKASALQANSAADLPELRRRDQEIQSAFQRLLMEREQLENEEGRLADLRRDLEGRLSHAAADIAREQARAVDAQGAVERLQAEREMLMMDAEGEEEARLEAEALLESAAALVAETDQELAQAVEEMAAADAERASAIRRLGEAETRRDRLKDRLVSLEQNQEALLADGMDRADLTAMEMDLEEASEYLEESRAEAEDWERAKANAQSARDAARDSLTQATQIATRLRAEAEGLIQVLAQSRRGDFPPVIDQINAQTGYEPALAAALGDDLAASLDADAPLVWVDLGPMRDAPALPSGVAPLSRHVSAPAAMARRLGQIGVVADKETAIALRDDLAVGQTLVTPDGGVLRWDGLLAKAGAPSAMALQLAQRNRLREVEMKLEDALLGEEEAQGRLEDAIAALEEAVEKERSARDAVRRADGEIQKLRDAHGKLAQKFAAWDERRKSITDQIDAATADMEEAQEAVIEAQTWLENAPQSLDEGKDRVNILRAILAERRSKLVEARSGLDRIIREVGERKRRLDGLAHDLANWVNRAEQAHLHCEELAERRESLMFELERLNHAPDSFAQRRAELLDKIEAADEGRKASADGLAAAEFKLAEADRALRAAETTLAEAREERVRVDASVGAAAQNCRVVAQRIDERMGQTPEQLREIAGALDEERPDPDELQRRLDRLNRERDGMGAVNLRAELEVTELEERLSGMRIEKDDLEKAIAKLRAAIAELNKEGRERLLKAFEQVDRHFRDLFVKLFGGGRAHLALIESTDPLQAGLEIMASPPGKRLQQLSLLSGGEQALTALALIFAVFLINPAPICVLDEVDAPLDDANVDRFCKLVEGIAQTTKTRFLIVTHHRMSMARMNRLYGVTMAERGVSQLVSVDLAQAEAIRDRQAVA